ncbi:hypothetical protein Tco_1275504 [Tanacetum coccineum]
MENANPPPTNNHPVLPAALRAQAIQEFHELQNISAFVDSRLESIERFLNDFTNQPNETNTNDLESDNESVDTPLLSPFPHSDNDSDDGEVLNELIEYENVECYAEKKAINSFDGDDLAFQCRKAHLLEDKQIPSVEVFSIWKAFGGNTRNLGSFGEETDETTDLHQHCSRISPQKLDMASQITRDAVTNPTMTASQDIRTVSTRTIQPII